VTAGPAELAKVRSPRSSCKLAWDTFAAAADLPAALAVAEAALICHAAVTCVWLERKAQASEWSGLAPQALAAWLELLKRNASERRWPMCSA
jgi:uncharacterized protein (DUF983 family)